MANKPEKKGIADTVQNKIQAPTAEVMPPAPAANLPAAPAPEKKKAYVGTSREVIPLVPSDLDGAWRMAIIFATSGLLPKSYGSGETETMAAKAFLAMQLGAEVGLSPMQAIQSIAIVNGQPSIWGDAMLALVRKSGLMDQYSESVHKEGKKENWYAVSRAQRGDEVVETKFTWQDAVTAQLSGKSGTWQTHPARMLLYKARAFTLRDLFSDVLKGLTHSVEEMEGEDLKVKAPAKTEASGFASRVPQNEETDEGADLEKTDEAPAQPDKPAIDAEFCEPPAPELWDKESIVTLRSTKILIKPEGDIDAGLEILKKLIAAENAESTRRELINLNLAFIGALARAKRMVDIQALHQSTAVTAVPETATEAKGE